jgi:hypothetical protein
MNKRLLYFLLSILCLVIGVGVYYFFKKDVLVYEAFIGIKKMNTGGYSFANWLPDLCWETSFLFMLSAVWGNWRLVPNSIKIVTLGLIIGTELLQMQGLLPGTGDIKDILVYFIGFSIFTLLFLTKRPKQNL